MNILFTGFCNRSCPYCLPKGNPITGKNSKDAFVNFKNLKTIVRFLKNSKQEFVGILGGEPTLHPKFKEAVTMILDKGLDIMIYSNGIMRDDTIGYLRGINERRWRMILNINEPADYARGEWLKIIKTMKILHNRIILGFTIYRLNFNADFIIKFIKKYNLSKSVRLGIASPIWTENNRYLHIENHKKVAPKIVEFAKKCNDFDISVMFDCGFTLCSFTEKECGELFYYGSPLRTFCDPVIDVHPDLTVRHCFATSTIWNKKLTDFQNLDEISEFYFDKFKAFRKVGATDKCFRCRYHIRGQCAGGCIGHALKFFNLEDRIRSAKLSQLKHLVGNRNEGNPI